MAEQVTFYLLTCGPVVLTGAAWARVYLARQRERQRPVALIALAVTSANAVLSVDEFLRLQFRSSSGPPPWQDPQILTLSMLFLLAPIGMVLGLVALARGGPKWLFFTVEIASAALCVVGLLASLAV